METSYENDPVLALVHQYPENVTADAATPINQYDLMVLGMQASQLLYDAGNSDAIGVLKRLSQDFPKYALDISRRVTHDTKLEEEVLQNNMKAQGGVSMAWLNGVPIPEADWNPFS